MMIWTIQKHIQVVIKHQKLDQLEEEVTIKKNSMAEL